MKFKKSNCFLLIASAALWAGCEPIRSDNHAAQKSAALTCPNPGEPSGPGACSEELPCDDGEGDCNSDVECAAGGRCLQDVGTAYGYDPDIDVCVVGCPSQGNGASNYCTVACPCGDDQGDCDDNNECQGGTVCVRDSGAAHGLDPDVDICEETEACIDDEYESNETAETAALLEFDAIDDVGNGISARIEMFNAQLCATNGDWYRIPSGALSRIDEFDTILLGVFIRDADCSSCTVTLPNTLANTLTVELYDATGTVLINAWTSDVGVVVGIVEASLPSYGGDLLVRVSGPGQAQYDYRFQLHIQNDDDDADEICDC